MSGHLSPGGGTARDARVRLLQLYLFATPAFLIADLVWGINVRVSFLDDFPVARSAYYALCLACAAAVWRWPRLTRSIAFLESSANIAMLVIGFWVSYVGLVDQIAADSAFVNPFTPAAVTNLTLSAAVLVVTYVSGFRARGSVFATRGAAIERPSHGTREAGDGRRETGSVTHNG